MQSAIQKHCENKTHPNAKPQAFFPESVRISNEIGRSPDLGYFSRPSHLSE